MNRMERFFFCGLIALTAFAGLAFGQQASPPGEGDDPAERPTEYGIRLTPTMARALGRVMTNEFLTRRYELDDAKKGEAGEAIARRLMQLAHKHEERGQEFVEWAFTEIINNAASRGKGGGAGARRPASSKAWASECCR